MSTSNHTAGRITAVPLRHRGTGEQAYTTQAVIDAHRARSLFIPEPDPESTLPGSPWPSVRLSRPIAVIETRGTRSWAVMLDQAREARPARYRQRALEERLHASDVVESGQVVDAPRDVGVLGSPRTPNPRGKPPRMAHRQPADILRDLEATATITDAAERFPKLNVLQHEAIAAARTNEALYAQVNERAEALAQQAIDQITRMRRDRTGG